MELNRYRVLLALLLLFAAGIVRGQGQVSDAAERNVLWALYNSLDGEHWVNPWPVTCINSYPQRDSVAKLTGISVVGGDIWNISLGDRRLTGTLPAALNSLTALQYISLGNSNSSTSDDNTVTGAMPNLGGLINLQSMLISDHRMTGIFPPWIGTLTALQTLNLSAGGGTGFTGPITNAIANLTSLRTLILDNNTFSGTRHIPDTLRALDGLTYLSLANCALVPASVDKGLSGLAGLQTLNLSSNSAFVENQLLPDRLRNLPSLETLYLRANGFQNFPSSFRRITSLRTLDLGDTHMYQSAGYLSRVIDTLKICPFIVTLGLTNSSITSLPSDFNELTVDVLQLSYNPLNPEQCNILGDMPELRTLYVDHCSLTSLPSHLEASASLNTLYANNNSLYPLPEVIKKIPNLITLNLDFNGIALLPDWFGTGAMDTLKNLSINNNKLVTFPKEFTFLENLSTLDVSHNLLNGTWPEPFDDLTSLTALDMSYNYIDSLPDLTDLKQLHTVLLHYNRLSGTVPLFLTDVSSDKVQINISHNMYSAIDSASYFDGPAPSVDISYNDFTFVDVLLFKPLDARSYYYSPQPLIDVERDVYSFPGASIKFLSAIDTIITSPGTRYQWFRSNGQPLGEAAEGAFRFVYRGVTASDANYQYYYEITHPLAPNLVLRSRMQTLILTCKGLLTGVGFTAKRYLCAMNFKPSVGYEADCHTVSYNWNFGDGTTSTERSPWHAYNSAGTFTVSLRVGYQCGTCQADSILTRRVNYQLPEDFLYDSLVEILTTKREQVINVSAASYSDAWPLEHNDDADTVHSYFNGSQGVWRNEGTYVYNKPRSKSAETNIARDGTFTLENFNWAYADLDAIPHWIKSNTVSQYSSYSYELENHDVLDVYSAAVYDYGGHLPTANGVNMRNNEMGFTGFEYQVKKNTDTDKKATGNFVFTRETIPGYIKYPVSSANNHIAVVEASLEQLRHVRFVDVSGRSLLGGVLFPHRRSNAIQDNEVICMEEHPTNPKWSMIVLRRALFPWFWKGEITVKREVVPPLEPVIDSTYAHTGTRSLKITTKTTFPQELLKLDSGKMYFVNAWVSVGNVPAMTPNLGDSLGIEVRFNDENNVLLTKARIKAEGPVINGWQQVRGSFRCPDHRTTLLLVFKPGNGTAWYDDLRLHPEKGNMKSYVYDLRDYKLRAALDEENFATLYFYNAEGELYLTKKETARGIKTISENISYYKVNPEKQNQSSTNK